MTAFVVLVIVLIVVLAITAGQLEDELDTKQTSIIPSQQAIDSIKEQRGAS
jgi:hypothetical protein